MSRSICGVCMCPYGDSGECACEIKGNGMKTVIEMARSVGARPQQNKNCDVEYLFEAEALERFAELVRADEREAMMGRIRGVIVHAEERGAAAEREECAKFLESTNLAGLPEDTALHYARLLKGFSEGIRARGNT